MQLEIFIKLWMVEVHSERLYVFEQVLTLSHKLSHITRRCVKQSLSSNMWTLNSTVRLKYCSKGHQQVSFQYHIFTAGHHCSTHIYVNAGTQVCAYIHIRNSDGEFWKRLTKLHWTTYRLDGGESASVSFTLFLIGTNVNS